MIGWAIDLWPYVNGKALMSGIVLGDMEAHDMVDVMHFLFEEDNHYTSEESVKSRSGVRVSIYKDMYGTNYKYAYKESGKGPRNGSGGYSPASASSTAVGAWDADLGIMSEEEDRAFANEGPEELKEPPKPFIPPTPFNPDSDDPFNGLLSKPMN